MQERTCAGLALFASYWRVPTVVPSQVTDPGLAAELEAELAAVAEALNVRCRHPVYLPRQRRAARGRRG